MKTPLKIILPILLLAAGAGGAKMLISMKPEAKRRPHQEEGTLVKVAALAAQDRPIIVRAHGAVTAARSVDLQPQVSGEITKLSDNLVPGGRVKAGETLIKIERRDYDLAVAQAKAQVAQSELNLELERGRGAVAKREWDMLSAKKRGSASKARALREPHAKSARAAVASAKAGLSQARLAANRTQIKAPFNALVISESAEVGQIASPGRALARLVGTDAFWVQASLPTSELAFIDLNGGAVIIRAQRGERTIERAGKVLRLLGDLEPQSRMARVIIEVEDPLGLEGGQPPLLLNDFVEVEMRHQTQRAIALPRVALREGDRVWVMKADNTLEFRALKIARRERDAVLVESGLGEGDKVITSRIGTAIPGMKLRLPEAKAPKGGPRGSKP